MKRSRFQLSVVPLILGVLLAGHAPTHAQSVYVSDRTNNVILKFTLGGVKSTFASGYSPYGLAGDLSGDLYACDFNGGNIYKYTSSGTRTTFATGLSAPDGLAFDSSGNLYVSSFVNIIYKITPGGTVNTFSTTGMNGPSSLAFDSTGDLFVADSDSGKILKFVKSGGVLSSTPTTFASDLTPNGGPQGVTVDSSGNVFAADFSAATIYKFTPGGSQSTFAGESSAAGMSFDNSGDLFAVSLGSGQVEEFMNNAGTLSNSPTVFASGLGQLVDVAISPTPEPTTGISVILGGVTLLGLRRARTTGKPGKIG